MRGTASHSYQDAPQFWFHPLNSRNNVYWDCNQTLRIPHSTSSLPSLAAVFLMGRVDIARLRLALAVNSRRGNDEIGGQPPEQSQGNDVPGDK